MSIQVTSGAGLSGTDFVLDLVLDRVGESDDPAINLDRLTYTGNLEKPTGLSGDARRVVVQDGIGYLVLAASYKNGLGLCEMRIDQSLPLKL